MWKQIPDTNYSVSDKGDIRNERFRSIKIKNEDRNGYEKVCLYKNGERTTKRVHRLVAEAFIDNPENKPCVNHIDGNKKNNNVNNLEWVTYSENMQHAVREGLAKPHSVGGMRGKKNPNGGRKPHAIQCTNTGEIFDSVKEACKYFNISDTCVYDCLNNRTQSTHGLKFKYL